MKIGIPKESMPGEGRIALVPEDCRSLVDGGHTVYIEQSAGVSSGYMDSVYEGAGVEILPSAKVLYQAAELIVKVKQPLEHDFQYLKQSHLLFCYLHLASDKPLLNHLSQLGLIAIPFESITNDSAEHPLLAPMSAIAGRLSVIRGARFLFGMFGGRGVLLGGVDGADAGRVVVIGTGIAGSHAAITALGLNAEVHVFDIIAERLNTLQNEYPKLVTHLSEPANIAHICKQADLVIGAVMVAGRRAPIVLSKEMIKAMPQGSVIIDIAIDQGGCVEGMRLTSSDELAYSAHGVIHSAVPNMPGAVPRTASQSLSSAVVPYVKRLLNGGLSDDAVLQAAVAVNAGEIVDPVLREEFGL